MHKNENGEKGFRGGGRGGRAEKRGKSYSVCMHSPDDRALCVLQNVLINKDARKSLHMVILEDDV